MRDLKQGDVLIIPGRHKKKILGLCGDGVLLSKDHDFGCAAGWYTKYELMHMGYKLEEPEEKPTDLVLDERVLVSEGPIPCVARHFSRYYDGRVWCWENGGTSHTTNRDAPWSNWKRPEGK